MIINGVELEGNKKANVDHLQELNDADWIANAFMIADREFELESDRINRYWSTASSKFTDTRLGANIGINPRPQFTPYSDIPDPGRSIGREPVSITNVTGNHGMGPYYSEAIDDPAQRIYLTCGVPRFNSLLTFLSRAWDSEQMNLARTGRSSSAFYSMGSSIGTFASFVAFPKVAFTVWAVKKVAGYFYKPTSKFYSFKPTMHVYWGAVNEIVNALLVNRGIVPPILDTPDKQRLGRSMTFDEEYFKKLKEIVPYLFGGANNIDMYAVSTKAQRLANQLFLAEFDKLENGGATDFTGYLNKMVGQGGTHASAITNSDGKVSLGAFLNRISKYSYWFSEKADSAKMETDPMSSVGPDGSTAIPEHSEDRERFIDYLDALFSDGAMFATFIVDHTGSVSETFSNASVESDLSQKLNSMSSDFMSKRFSFADGNVLPETIGGVLEGAYTAVKDVVVGGIDSVTMGGFTLLRGLGGNGYIDIQKHWQSSSASLASSNYSITLITPYGNPISSALSLDVPLAMLMAAALPRSQGYGSYGAPFLIRMYDPGRTQIQEGYISSLTITRGVSNLAFTRDHKALALKVDITFENMSSIMHMPISTGKIGELNMTLDESNILSDYLAVLTGQDIYTQLYPLTKAKLKFAKKIMNANKFTSPAFLASAFHTSATTGLLKHMSFGTVKVIEAMSRGVSVTGTAIQ